MLSQEEALELQQLHDELPVVSSAAVECLSGPLTQAALDEYRQLEGRVREIIGRIKAIID
jgi:hypothetical protein